MIQKLEDMGLLGVSRPRTPVRLASTIAAADEPACGELPPGPASDHVRAVLDDVAADMRKDKVPPRGKPPIRKSDPRTRGAIGRRNLADGYIERTADGRTIVVGERACAAHTAAVRIAKADRDPLAPAKATAAFKAQREVR